MFIGCSWSRFRRFHIGSGQRAVLREYCRREKTERNNGWKKIISHEKLLLVAGTAVAGRCAGYNSSVGQRDSSCVDQVRAVFCAVTIDDDHVTQFDVAPLETSPRERTR